MEVKSGHFRCISNFIYSYDNICDLEQVLLWKEKKAAEILAFVQPCRKESVRTGFLWRRFVQEASRDGGEGLLW